MLCYVNFTARRSQAQAPGLSWTFVTWHQPSKTNKSRAYVYVLCLIMCMSFCHSPGSLPTVTILLTVTRPKNPSALPEAQEGSRSYCARTEHLPVPRARIYLYQTVPTRGKKSPESFIHCIQPPNTDASGALEQIQRRTLRKWLGGALIVSSTVRTRS